METKDQRASYETIYKIRWGISVKEKISTITNKLKPIK
jgi:hypothetical protein